MSHETGDEETVLQKDFLVKNRSGIHCRAAVQLVDAISGYDATVQLIFGKGNAGGGSILDIIALGCVEGSLVTVRSSGRDAREALRAVEKIFNERFGEE